jgi:hypothetical protein
MFTVMKVREGLARDDYKDPGWYKHPAGTVAHEAKEDVAEAPHRQSAAPARADEVELTVVKPRTNSHNSH